MKIFAFNFFKVFLVFISPPPIMALFAQLGRNGGGGGGMVSQPGTPVKTIASFRKICLLAEQFLPLHRQGNIRMLSFM